MRELASKLRQSLPKRSRVA